MLVIFICLLLSKLFTDCKSGKDFNDDDQSLPIENDDTSGSDETIDDDIVDHDDDSGDDVFDDDSANGSYRIVSVIVEDHNTYRLANPLFPQLTGDLWPCAWGEDDRLYVANGDGMGFGLIYSDIVFGAADGFPPEMVGAPVKGAFGPFIAGKWGPEAWKYNCKPTGMTCVDGDIYLFFQNLANFLSDEPFGDAPHASISVTSDGGLTWHFDSSAPMFTDYIFTTGFFLDYGKCQEYARDEYVYVYGLDYNWRFSENFSQTKMYLARAPKQSILEINSWEFFAGFHKNDPIWTPDIRSKVPVLEDDTLYRDDKSGIAQGSVVYIPPLNRYLYSTRAVYEWIFYEAPNPWGPWTKVSVVEWTGSWTETYHPGYPTVIPSKFLDEDGRGGWIISSLSSSTFNGMYYNMAMRKFWLEVEETPDF